MELAVQIVWGILYGGAIFAFKTLVGMIRENQKKSDEADHRLSKMVDNIESKFRANDHNLFEKCAEIKADVAEIRAVVECLKGRA